MRPLERLFASRGARIGMVVLWLVLGGLGGSFAQSFQNIQKNEESSFLPGSSESVRELTLAKRFPSGERFAAITVIRRDGGLTSADAAAIEQVKASLTASPPPSGSHAAAVRVSRDHTTALLIVDLKPRGEETLLKSSVSNVERRVTPLRARGLTVKVSGPAGLSRDAVNVFSSINGTLLLATAGLVFVLLIIIYRSPIFWVIPLFSVLMAEAFSRFCGWAIAEAGVTVNGQSAGVLPVLVFGAGTDYALLLVARYREELRRHERPVDAMRQALRRAGPAVLASGSTVILALLCLSLAQVNGTSGLGPIGAMGVALAIAAMLTLLPAALVIGGRRAFWPFVPRQGSAGADETHGAWRQVGERVSAHPRRVWVTALLLLGAGCLGLTSFSSGLTNTQDFRGAVESVQGQQLIARAFPAGSNAPTDIVVRDVAALPAVERAVRAVPGVAAVGAPERGQPGARFAVILKPDPYSIAAKDLIPRVRAAAHGASSSALVGGPTAQQKDFDVAAAHDNRVIVPIVLLVVFLILVLLLRAIVLPLTLIATVVLSFGAALGVAALVFKHLFGYPGETSTLPLLAFIFLVALGVDYNIFLMARTREETLRHGTRLGMLRGLAVTGGVITSAGIVLAGTFTMLATLPLKTLTELGFTIAFGVLLDTFIVRSVLVPALVFDAGPRVWWPSALARRDGVSEEPGDEEPAETLPVGEAASVA
ncbi:MAG TPA: MMPL family transporter [Solirubrobacteraceae bacterium]|nr:MMPL family transporter [Solirubrobacteraceae bacterium]